MTFAAGGREASGVAVHLLARKTNNTEEESQTTGEGYSEGFAFNERTHSGYYRKSDFVSSACRMHQKFH